MIQVFKNRAPTAYEVGWLRDEIRLGRQALADVAAGHLNALDHGRAIRKTEQVAALIDAWFHVGAYPPVDAFDAGDKALNALTPADLYKP